MRRRVVETLHTLASRHTGEQIVLVAVTSAHRGQAFAACEFLMDFLKTQAPFWKKEHRTDGVHWIEPTDRDRTDATRWREVPAPSESHEPSEERLFGVLADYQAN